MNIFEFFSSNKFKALRRNAKVRITLDSNGKEKFEFVEGVSHTLSPDGSIDSIEFESNHQFYACGHTMKIPAGGRCLEKGCSAILCVNCVGQCAICLLPICLAHSNWLLIDQKKVRLCQQCHNDLKRRQIFKALLSPFVEFNDQ